MRVSQLVAPHAALSPVLVKALAGIVGAQAAVAFAKFLGDARRIRPEDVLLHLDDALAATLRALRVQDLAHLNRDLLHHVEDQAPKLTPARRKKILAGVERYLGLMREGRQTEVVADFINLTERPELAQASALLLASPAMVQLFTDYIEKVKL